MNVYALALGIAGAGALIALATKAEAANVIPTTTQDLDAIFKKYGSRYNVDALLLKAVAMVESQLKPDAVRDNPPRDVSVGLMQILCLPDGAGGCSNAFNIDGWDGITFERLKDADTNVALGAQILSWNLRQFGFPRGIAVYNSWTERHSPLEGPFGNAVYVNKVLSNYRALAQRG